MTERVADVLLRILVEGGVEQAFLVTGGGAMHLNDAVGKAPGMRWLACHHEQACAMAAQSYARVTGYPALVNVTTGPGGTNALSGVYGAWVDSLPMVVVSGQVKRQTMLTSTGLPLRQLGDQEADITRIAAPITKYATCLLDPLDTRYVAERALHLATQGRPGPVWIDVPVDVQGTQVEFDQLRGYDPAEDVLEFETDLVAAVDTLLERLAAAQRPVILAGSGVRISGCHARFLRILTQLGLPIATAFNAHDVVPNEHPQYVGRPGTVGDRPGNFAIQNADFVLVLGCRLNIRQIGYAWESFARQARIAMVDVDRAELQKPTLKLDLPIHADLSDFIAELERRLPLAPVPAHREYLDWCRARVARYPVVLPEYSELDSPINPYVFGQRLSAQLPNDAITVTANATACVTMFQSAVLKGEQRLFSDSGSAPMGFDLPAAIGAATAAPGKRIVCLAGDGSIMMNLQELATIAYQRFPIAIFLLDNAGYLSIRSTQNAFFPDGLMGFDAGTGVGFPDFAALTQAFGLPYRSVDSHQELDTAIGWALEGLSPRLCHIHLKPNQPFAPKAAARRLDDGSFVSAPLEDLAPFLPRNELAENLLTPPQDLP